VLPSVKTMSRKLYVTILLLQYRVLSIWLPPYKEELKVHENFVISDDVSLSDDDEEILNGKDKDSLDLNLGNSKSDSQHRQMKQSPIPEESQDMEDISLNMWY
jgi:hypothetical protein